MPRLKNKRNIKTSLTELFTKALEFYKTKELTDQEFIKFLIKRTIQEIELIKSPRSYEQNALYHMVLIYMQYNIPEAFVKHYNEVFKTNRKVFSKAWWHLNFKDEFGIESTAFDNADGFAFTTFMNQVTAFAANDIFYCKVNDFMEAVRNFYDDYQKGNYDHE